MMKLPDFPVEGGCACGQVRYRLNAAPRLAYTCHCTDCQKLTTSAFTLSAPVRRETLEILKGRLRTWVRTTTESGLPTTQHVCENCGVRIFSEPPQAPENLTLRLGTLDDPHWVYPMAAIWMRSAQPWFEPRPGMLTYEKGDADWQAVGAAWRAQFE